MYKRRTSKLDTPSSPLSPIIRIEANTHASIETEFARAIENLRIANINFEESIENANKKIERAKDESDLDKIEKEFDKAIEKRALVQDNFEKIRLLFESEKDISLDNEVSQLTDLIDVAVKEYREMYGVRKEALESRATRFAYNNRQDSPKSINFNYVYPDSRVRRTVHIGGFPSEQSDNTRRLRSTPGIRDGIEWLLTPQSAPSFNSHVRRQIENLPTIKFVSEAENIISELRRENVDLSRKRRRTPQDMSNLYDFDEEDFQSELQANIQRMRLDIENYDIPFIESPEEIKDKFSKAVINLGKADENFIRTISVTIRKIKRREISIQDVERKDGEVSEAIDERDRVENEFVKASKDLERSGYQKNSRAYIEASSKLEQARRTEFIEALDRLEQALILSRLEDSEQVKDVEMAKPPDYENTKRRKTKSPRLISSSSLNRSLVSRENQIDDENQIDKFELMGEIRTDSILIPGEELERMYQNFTYSTSPVISLPDFRIIDSEKMRGLRHSKLDEKELNTKNASIQLEKKGLSLVDYENSDKVTVVCRCGDQYTARLRAILKGAQCKKCGNLGKKVKNLKWEQSIIAKKEIFSKNASIQLEERGLGLVDYENSKKVTVICYCGDQYTARLGAILEGAQCRKCSSLVRKERIKSRRL